MWMTSHGNEVTEQVRNPDHQNGIGWVRMVGPCKMCDGRAMRRESDGIMVRCPRCDGTGQRVYFRMVFTRKKLMEVKARGVRLRIHRQNREAEAVRRRVENFESECAETLALLRNYQRHCPRFPMMLREAERAQYMSDAFIEEVNSEYEQYRERIREAEEAQADAERSEHVGSPGDRITIVGTVRRHRMSFGNQVEMAVVDDEGNWYTYGGRASNLSMFYRGQRVRFDARVRGHVTTTYTNADGRAVRMSVGHSIRANATRVQRPSRARVIEEGNHE